MHNNIAISGKNLGKCYQLYHKPYHRLKQALFNRLKHRLTKIGSTIKQPNYHQEFWALRDISFEIKKGEALGIIGVNGSGKSTLLQLISGTLTPTYGEIKINGRVGALLELGAGFNPEFTGRENVYMSGAILGLTRKEIETKFAEIVEFSDIGEFLEQPVKTYSSGMFVRLAFAVQVCIRPDILIVDEALGVGDIFFQQKCYAKIRQMIALGTTCLLVSHDTTAILNLCNQVMLLNKGEIEYFGAPEEAVSRYFSRAKQAGTITAEMNLMNKENFSSIAMQDMNAENIIANNILNYNHRHGGRDLEILAARITDQQGKDTCEITLGHALRFTMLIKAHKTICNASAGIHLFDRLGNLVFAAGMRQLQQQLPDLTPGQMLVVSLEITFTVQPGEYTFSLGVSEPGDDPNVGYIQDRHEMLGPIIVTADLANTLPFYGIAQLPMKIEVSALTGE